jgi:putative toxin-antitoxin system antitoxin component (TIGR02293 family)
MSPQALFLQDVLGLPDNTPLPPMALLRRLRDGLPVRAIETLAKRIAPDDTAFKYRIVSKATLARRKEAKPQRLSSEESERLMRLAGVWAFAEEVWGGADAARRFMFEPHALLDGQTPISVALSGELGGKLVQDVLGRLAYGSAV